MKRGRSIAILSSCQVNCCLKKNLESIPFDKISPFESIVSVEKLTSNKKHQYLNILSLLSIRSQTKAENQIEELFMRKCGESAIWVVGGWLIKWTQVFFEHKHWSCNPLLRKIRPFFHRFWHWHTPTKIRCVLVAWQLNWQNRYYYNAYMGLGLGNAIYCILLQMLRESSNADFYHGYL